MKLPVINKGTRPIYPTEFKCPVCGNVWGEPNSFACIMGGAMVRVNKNLKEMDTRLSGYLNISFYSSYGKGKGPRGGVKTRDIVVDSQNGQFDLYFCSIPCMKKFFVEIFDDMEVERNKPKRKKLR